MLSQIKLPASRILKHLMTVHKYNVMTLQVQPLLEVSGAFGDLGTFIPIFVALVGAKQISAPSTLVFSGIANILIGLVFGIPLPVQPMKAIAAVALDKDLGNAEIAGAGLFVALAVGILGFSGLLDWFTCVVPVPVVKGIQVGAGLSLILSAFSKYFPTHWDLSFDFGLQIGLLLLTLILLLSYAIHPRTPFLLIIIVLSIVIGVLTTAISNIHWDIWQPETLVPNRHEFWTGAITAGLGQLPLTTLNSVLAVVVLAQDLFPSLHDQDRLPSARQIGVSITLMNAVSLWFRAMPMCHGSGGLAAQYRFGARSGASVIILGLIKLLLGLFVSDIVTSWCRMFSESGAAVLGLLILLAGLELAKMGQNLNSKDARDLTEDIANPAQIGTRDHVRDTNRLDTDRPEVRVVSSDENMRRWTIMTVTVGTLLGTGNDGIGFLSGMLVHFTYQIVDRYHGSDEGRIRLESSDI